MASAPPYLHLPFIRTMLLADLSLAAEQACDEVACAATGDRLVKLFAMHAPRLVPNLCPTSHLNDSNVGVRVMTMLNAPQLERPSARTFWSAGVLVVLALAVLGDPLHHATESLLGLLFH